MAFLLPYVDDIVLMASSTSFLQQIISALHREFSMTDMGPLHHFLGATVERQDDNLFLSRLVLLLLQGNGSSITSSCLMAHLTATKLGGFFADLLSIQELIMMRPSALSSSYYYSGGTHIGTVSLLSHSTAGYDVNNAFLHGTLTEIAYCVQPSGFVHSSRPDHVCRLN